MQAGALFVNWHGMRGNGKHGIWGSNCEYNKAIYIILSIISTHVCRSFFAYYTTVAFPFSELKITSTMLGSFCLPQE